MGICWLILQEARWAPTNLALGNFLRREKMGEQICYGATRSTVGPVTGASSRVMGISLRLMMHSHDSSKYRLAPTGEPPGSWPPAGGPDD